VQHEKAVARRAAGSALKMLVPALLGASPTKYGAFVRRWRAGFVVDLHIDVRPGAAASYTQLLAHRGAHLVRELEVIADGRCIEAAIADIANSPCARSLRVLRIEIALDERIDPLRVIDQLRTLGLLAQLRELAISEEHEAHDVSPNSIEGCEHLLRLTLSWAFATRHQDQLLEWLRNDLATRHPRLAAHLAPYDFTRDLTFLPPLGSLEHTYETSQQVHATNLLEAIERIDPSPDTRALFDAIRTVRERVDAMMRTLRAVIDHRLEPLGLAPTMEHRIAELLYRIELADARDAHKPKRATIRRR
jgi:hypothetical protein